MTEPAPGGDRGPRPDFPGTRSQTLDRGIRVLEILHEAGAPMTIAGLAGELKVHRSIIYRILRTLEDHRLVGRTGEGSYELGLGLPVLARGVSPGLQSAALPAMSLLANETGKTAFLVVPSGGEAITLLSVEPRQSVAHIAYAPGMRHPLEQGAPGMALLSAWPPRQGERPEVARAREQGWAYSRSEVLPGMSSVAAPITSTAGPAAVSVVYLEAPALTPEERAELGLRVRAAAREIMLDLP
ncbi:IclR family transcriptional regulator [Nocardiopsis ansamitocini]|uniref:Transcriptional regulator n=1 Tax=Nocardiopsis ansamitocini TaxID=1670832 RepID=A0A9W6P658_9ACTN|nr:IclR family transcriptional regulator [Nocardiopsis ansamitocini]GLU47784.1 transcriptional regulator [Nocardiopsis ansamitocini]